MSARVQIQGIDSLSRELERLPRNVGANSFKATARKAGREVVKASRSTLGKKGNFPDISQIWKAIGVKSIRRRSSQIGVVVKVRKEARYDGKLTVAGAAKLVEKGNYKTPGRKGRGDVTRYAIGDYILDGFDKVSRTIEDMFEREFIIQLRKRL